MTTEPQKSAASPDRPLWQPSAKSVQDATITHFMTALDEKTGQSFSDYDELWQWSTDNVGAFWSFLWDYCHVIGEKGERTLINEGDLMKAAFFPDARLNYAQNMLKNGSQDPAMIFRNEKGGEVTYTFKELYDAVSRWQLAMIEAGVVKGDRVAGYMPNMPETVIAMLAATSLGAIWSSASPDFGVQGVVDRFGQIEPTVFVAVDGLLSTTARSLIACAKLKRNPASDSKALKENGHRPLLRIRTRIFAALQGYGHG
jgi:acetoacetyl-CoA synthetase